MKTRGMCVGTLMYIRCCTPQCPNWVVPKMSRNPDDDDLLLASESDVQTAALGIGWTQRHDFWRCPQHA